MRVHGVLVAILLLTTVFAATAAPAAVMVYTDRASFEAAIGPHVTYTFDSADGFPTAPDRVSTFGPVSAWDRVVGQAAYLRGWPTSSGNQTISGIYDDVVTQRLLLTFDPPQNVIGFDMYTFGASGVARIHFNDGSGQFFDVGQSITYSTFLGLTSTDPIVDLVVENAGDSRSQRYKGIDNFTIIPEPSFWSLGALIVAVQGLFHRRRESRPRLIPRRASWPNDCEILDHRLHLSATGTFTGTYDLNVDNEVNTTYTPALHADFSQAEQAIAIDPNNPARMFVFANDGRPSGSGSHPPDNGMFAAYSVDAGATWHFMVADGLVGTGAIGDPFGSTVLRGDPSVIFDQYGNLFIASLADSANGRILTLALSTDGGQTIADQW